MCSKRVNWGDRSGRKVLPEATGENGDILVKGTNPIKINKLGIMDEQYCYMKIS